MRVLATAVVMSGLLLAAGCGGEDEPPTSAPSSSETASTRSADAPDAADLAKVLIASQDGSAAETYTQTEATCVAQVLIDSALTDESLKQIATDLTNFAPSAEEEAVYRSLVPLITTCVAGRVSSAP